VRPCTRGPGSPWHHLFAVHQAASIEAQDARYWLAQVKLSRTHDAHASRTHATHAREARSIHAAAKAEGIEGEPVPGLLPKAQRLATLGRLLLGITEDGLLCFLVAVDDI